MNTHKRMDERILIVGCGYVGSRLATELLGFQATVLGLRRRVEKLPVGVVPVPADLGSPGTLPEVPELDGLVYSPSAGERTEEAYRRAYVDGVDRLADALGGRAANLRRAIFVSSTAVYGELEGAVDEATKPEPGARTSQLILDGEARFVARFPNAVVLRLAGIYGPTRNRMVRQVQSAGPFDTDHAVIGNRIHRDDCAGALVHVLRQTAPEPIVVGVDHAPVPHGEVRAFIAEKLGLPTEAYADFGAPRGKKLSNARLVASGYAFRVPTYREGYPAIIAESLAR